MFGTTTESKPMNPHPRRWLILLVILAAEIMDLFDGTIVNVALPTIRLHLHSSDAALQWIAGGYSLALAIGLIVGGRMGDRYGRRRLFVIGAVGFTGCSLACGLSDSTAMLVAFRLAQGAFGALLIPQGLGIMRAIFPKDELPKAFALFGPVIGGAAVLGPIIGGLLVSVHTLGGWRLIFFVNLPLGTAAAIGAALLMPEVRAPTRPRIDLLGSAIVCVAMLALVYPLIEGREAGWPAWTFLSLAGGVALLAIFAVQQVARTRAGRDALVQPKLFRNRGYSSGTLVLLVFFLGMTGVLFVLTLFLQIGQGFSALHSGLTFVPWSLGLAVGAGLSGGLLANRYGRHVLEAGGGVSVIGLLLLILESRSGLVSTWEIVPGLLVMGLGMGLIVAPLFGIIIAAVADDEVGSASGVLNAVQQLASAIGVALLGTVFFDALGAGGFHRALSRTLWIDLGLTVLAIVLMPLMPMHARPEEDVLFAEDA
ncbi:MAG TPA: MFS transporter [Gaiellaceae bacterium]|nr:MFS transporter [Gaiellaceae bacterium]